MLTKYPFIRTSDFQSAHDAMIGTGVTSFNMMRDSGRFFMSSNFVRLKSLSLIYVNCTLPGQMEMSPATFVRQYFPMAGSGRLTVHGESRDICAGNPGFVVPSEHPLTFEGGPDYQHLAIRIEIASLEKKLSAMLGEELTDDLRFDSTQPLSGRNINSIQQAVFQLALDLDFLGDTLPDIAVHELEQAILIRYLLFHSHNYTRLLARPPSAPSRGQVKAAKEYIEANWDSPMDVEAVARAVGTSARSLFRHFKESENCSPNDFAKTVRLARARMMLRSAGNDISVIRVAQICGFRSFGHFARDYRITYGERPSDTMRHADR